MTETDKVKIEIPQEFYTKVIQDQQAQIDKLKRQLQEMTLSDTKEIKIEKKKKPQPEDVVYSEYKCNGVKKARKADSIRSYDEFKMIQDYFVSKDQMRNYALWTIGVSLGLRISDLTQLRFKHFLFEDMKNFRERIKIYEQKTSKLNDILITESCREAIKTLLEHESSNCQYGDFIFANRRTGEKIDPKTGWRIISNAGKELGLPIVCGSHTMRKSFANIAACVDTSFVDMNSVAKIQGLLNHSDAKTTMRYLGTYKDMYDRARIAVSDFVLGRSSVNELIAGSSGDLSRDIMDKMQEIETLIVKGVGEKGNDV